MVRFAHLSDTHLGYRQYGLQDREDDFYKTFARVIGDIIHEDVDFVIHSGDLFETNRPSNKAHFVFQKALDSLNDAGIPFYALSGNHDISLKKDSIPPQVLYRNQGLNLLSPNVPEYIFDDNVYIGGVEFTPVSYKRQLYKDMEERSIKAQEYDTRIIVLHQGIDKFMPFNYELEIGTIPENFQYYAMGHLHNYINVEYGEGRLVYPGSTEIWKTSEIRDYWKNKKGYVISTIRNGKVETERKIVDIQREFLNETIQNNNLLTELQSLKNQLREFKVKPIINVTIQGDKFNTQEAYDTVHKYLDEYSLQVRPTFNLTDTPKTIISEELNSLNPKGFLKEYVKDSKIKGADNFITDLYDKLKVNQMEEAQTLTENMYNDSFGVLTTEKNNDKKETVKNKTNLMDWS